MLIYFVYQKEDDRSVDICIECLYLAISFVKSHVRALYILSETVMEDYIKIHSSKWRKKKQPITYTHAYMFANIYCTSLLDP